MMFGIEDGVFGFCSQLHLTVEQEGGGNVREGAHETIESRPLVRQERNNNMTIAAE